MGEGAASVAIEIFDTLCRGEFSPSRGAESAEWDRSGRAWTTCAGGRGAFGTVDFADRIGLSSKGEGNSLQNLREMRHLCVAAMPHNLTEMNSCAAKG